jgi:hypothetical protein
MFAPPTWLPIDTNVLTRCSIVPAVFSPKTGGGQNWKRKNHHQQKNQQKNQKKPFST